MRGSILNPLYATDDLGRIILSPNSPINITGGTFSGNFDTLPLQQKLDLINANVSAIISRLPSVLVNDRLKVDIINNNTTPTPPTPLLAIAVDGPVYAPSYAIGADAQLAIDKTSGGLLCHIRELNKDFDSVTIHPSSGVMLDRSGTIQNANTNQTIAMSNADRSYFFLQNVGSYEIWLNFGANASAAPGSIKIPPDASYVMEGSAVCVQTVNVAGPVAGTPYTAKEMVLLEAAGVQFPPNTPTTPTVTLNAETIAYQNSIIANGGSISNTALLTTNNFVETLKSAGIWAKAKMLWTAAGDQLAAGLVALKHTAANQLLINNGFTSGSYAQATGFTPGTAGPWLDTGINPATVLTNNNHAIGVYSHSTQAPQGFDTVDMGIGDDSFTNNRLLLSTINNGGFAMTDSYSQAGRLQTLNPTAGKGLFISNRTASDNLGVYGNGTLLGSSTNSVTGAQPSGNIHLFGMHDTTLGTARFQSARPLSFAIVGDALTSGEMSALYNAYVAFCNAIGRSL
jgi:hypothetical protein